MATYCFLAFQLLISWLLLSLCTFYFIFLSQNSLNPVQLCYMRFEDHHLLFRLKPMIYLTWFASPHEVEPPLVIFPIFYLSSVFFSFFFFIYFSASGIYFCISIWEYKPREIKLWIRRLNLKGVHKAHLQQFQPFGFQGWCLRSYTLP